ncbi:MAG: transporter, partial [Clostridia bacterium]
MALDPIDTDGPDFVESSEVVRLGGVQYEVDLTSARNRPSRPTSPSLSTPILLKYGFAENFELRIAPDGYLRQDGASGFGDTAVGIKWHAQDRDAEKRIPAISWILHFDTPSGTRELRGVGVRPSLRSVVTWELPGDFALGIMPGIKYDARDDGHRFMSTIFGSVLNKRITERLRAFVEISSPQIASQANGGVLASGDVGAAYL